MTARAICRRERATGLLGWALVAAVFGFLLWIVLGGAAHAEEPKAAARAIGNAGTAAARAIARDSSNAADVPGYAGTNLPERSIGANALEDEGRARLADPDDPGGTAGRAVVEGVTSRPERPVAADDPAVMRGKAVAASPQSSAHGADGLASGSASGCGAELEDAQGGGSCGSVRYCVGAGCETVSPQSNTGFVEATTRLNMAIELGGEEFDREDMRFFKGKRQRCHIHFGGWRTAARTAACWSGLPTARLRNGSWRKSGTRATPTISADTAPRRPLFGICIRRSRAWCVFGSKLGRILQQQGRAQLGIGWGNCRGLTVAEIEGIDFASLDLSEFTEDLMDASKEPSVSLPDAGDTGEAMRTRIRDFYSRGQ